MKTFICLIIFSGFSVALKAQSIVGKWQLLKQTHCMEENMTASDESEQKLVDDMKNMTAATPYVVTFKQRLSGEESMRLLTRKRNTKSKSFLYKFTGDRLMILDKRSQTITDNYLVEKFSSDSLIIANSTRPCEIKVFERIE